MHVLVMEDFGQKLRGARALRAREKDVFGRVFDDRSFIHENDAVRDTPSKSHLVGDHHHRHSRAGKVGHDIEHFIDHLGIECGGWLVEQHDRRIHGKRARDGYALLLSAREA